jgi:hypothetical protein
MTVTTRSSIRSSTPLVLMEAHSTTLTVVEALLAAQIHEATT